MGEHSYETILNLDQWFRSCRLKKKKITDNAQRPITISHIELR